MNSAEMVWSLALWHRRRDIPEGRESCPMMGKWPLSGGWWNRIFGPLHRGPWQAHQARPVKVQALHEAIDVLDSLEVEADDFDAAFVSAPHVGKAVGVDEGGGGFDLWELLDVIDHISS